MTTADKTLERMRNNPPDWRIDDLLTLAERYGVEVRNSGGSHHVFSVRGIADSSLCPGTSPNQAGLCQAVHSIDRHDQGENVMSVKKIKPVTAPYPFEAYGHIIAPLSVDDGGGYMITFPDLPGCMSDGETMEEVLINGRDAFKSWIAAQMDMKRHIPEPTHYDEEGKPVKFVQRLPRSLHASLQARARAEGVSLNTIVLMLIAEGLGRHEGTPPNEPARHVA